MTYSHQYLTLDTFAEKLGRPVAIVEEMVTGNELAAYCRLSSKPLLWLYKYDSEKEKISYCSETSSYGLLKILNYNLVVWTDGGGGMIKCPDNRPPAEAIYGPPLKVNEIYQFKDKDDNYYRIPKNSEVKIQRIDILIDADFKYTSEKEEDRRRKQKWKSYAEKLLDEHDANKNVAVFLLLKKYGQRGTEKVKPYLSVGEAGKIIGVRGWPQDKSDKQEWTKYRARVNRMRKKGRESLIEENSKVH